MDVADLIAEKLHVLPPDRQREVLDFVDFLAQRAARGRPRRDPGGLWADLGVEVTAQGIDELRKELWGSFPRDDI